MTVSSNHIRHVTPVEVFNSFLWDNLLLDLRPLELYELDHIDRAECCPVGSDTNVEFEYHEQRRTVIVYDADGTVCSRSPGSAEEQHLQKLIARFVGSGVVSVWLLEGGFASFKSAYPVLCTAHEQCDPYVCYPQQIVPGVFLGAHICAEQVKVLQNLQITHILNCTMELNRHIDTAVQYCQIPVEDTLEQDLSTHFKTAADFIHKAVSNNGRALVHCERGCSRSATFVISYLILMKGMSVAEAVEHVRQCRSVIAPNASFMLQLHNFEQHCKTAAV